MEGKQIKGFGGKALGVALTLGIGAGVYFSDTIKSAYESARDFVGNVYHAVDDVYNGSGKSGSNSYKQSIPYDNTKVEVMEKRLSDLEQKLKE